MLSSDFFEHVFCALLKTNSSVGLLEKLCHNLIHIFEKVCLALWVIFQS
jgi:hypothetical protein